MGCGRFDEAISAWSDGELDHERTTALEAHLVTCQACRAHADRVLRLNRHLRLRAADPVPDLTEVLLSRVAALAPAPASRPVARLSGPARRLTPAAGFAALFLLAFGIGQAASRVSHALPAPAAPAGAADRAHVPSPPVIVEIRGGAFRPTDLVVRQGEPVVWLNRDPVAHELVQLLGSGEVTTSLTAGSRVRTAFDAPGTYAFYCTTHRDLRGEILVVPR